MYVLTRDEVEEAVVYIRERGAFAFDVETRGADRINPRVAEVTWLSLATEDHSWVIPMGHPNGETTSVRLKPNKKGAARLARGVAYEDLNPRYDLSKEEERVFGPTPKQLSKAEVFGVLRPIFFDPDIEKIGHNIKFDLKAVAKYYGGVPPVPPYYDTVVGTWVRDVSYFDYALKTCAKKILKVEVEKGVGENVDLYGIDEVAKYSLIDARVTWDLYAALESWFEGQPRSQRLIRDLEMSVLEPVLQMEMTGVLVDEPLLREIGDELRADITVAEANAIRMAGPIDGKPFNVASNRHKQIVLYGRRGMKPKVLTPAGRKKADAGEELTISDYSVNAEALAEMEGDALVDQITHYQRLSKLYGTYVLPYIGGYKEKDGVREEIKPRLERGRIFAEFKQHGAESGRFASANPNLQNIPNRSAEGRRLRGVFVADPGQAFVVADFSQIEPRIIASLSGDKTMIETYRDGGDVYQVVADRLGVDRRIGKELVLSIAYGVGPTKISARTGLSTQQARDLMEFFSEEFRAVPKHKAMVINKARRRRGSETILGRFRPLPHIKYGTRDEIAKAERQAYNHRIQGSAADVMKMALVGIYDTLPSEARLLLTVHDEVVVSVPEHLVEDVSHIVKAQMEAVDLFTVPLVAEVGSGHSWGEAH
jgi:DNA polymerase-1